MVEKRVKVNDVTIALRDDEYDGQALFLLHFGGANLMMWERAIPFFQNRYRLIRVDLRGHGKSDCPATGYHMDDMADDIAGVMSQLNVEKSHILGSSLGAEVGLSLAANYPDRVLSLVCDGALASEYGPFGTWVGTQSEYEAHVADFMEKLGNSPEKIYPTVQALVEARRESLEGFGWWNDYVDAMERYGAVRLDEGQYTSAFRKHARGGYFRHYFSYRFEDYYARVVCPLLVIAGEEVYRNPREKAAMEGLCKLASRAQMARIESWEHPYGWLTNPDGACRAVLRFLDEIEN